MVTIYRSIDGKEFTSETACKKHEREAVLSSNIKNEIVFYDENGQQIDFFEGIEDFDNTVWYILAKTNEAAFGLEAVVDKESCLYGLGGKGFYFFDTINLKWYTIEEYEDVYPDYKKAKMIKDKIQNSINKEN